MALGADVRRIVIAIFSRAFAQVGIGIAAGSLSVFALTNAIRGLSLAQVGASRPTSH